jgi:anti-sigma-K factor RskA
MVKRDLDILAGEYALGTLDADDRSEAERLKASDVGFARAVSEWEERLSPLSEAVTPVNPPASAWNKIESALAAPASSSSTALSELAAQMVDLKRSLAIWRYATMGAVAAVVALAVVWVGGLDTPSRPAPPEERYVAMLQSDKGETGFVITMNMHGKQFAIRPVSAQAHASKSYELWAIMKDGKKSPMTLGLVGTGAYAMMDAPVEIDGKMLEKGVQLAISLEPEGGAPKGRPMGPVMFAGLLVKQTQ